MNKQQIKAVALTSVLSVGAMFGSISVQAADTKDALNLGASKTAAAQKSQKRIDQIVEKTDSIVQDYRVVSKEIEALEVYIGQLTRQIEAQTEQVEQLEESIADATVLERRIMPLVSRMITALEQFVELDIPFHKEERVERVAKLRENLDRADLSVAEKFRQVLEAYKIEAEFGRKITNYKDLIDINGTEREVNILQVGRVALVYQTTDTKISGVWDADNKQWIHDISASEFRGSINKGIKIAKKQATIDILQLPIAAPEAAQ